MTTWRTLLAIVGSVLLFLGLIMLITPGPGLLFVLAGLAVLAKGFSWPKRLLNWLKDKVPNRE